MKQIIIVLMMVIMLSSCYKSPDPPAFANGDKVCYIDDSTLNGRVIDHNYCGGNIFQYRVQWRVTNISVSGGILGSSSATKPFAWVWHKEWELKLVKEEKINGI